MSSSTAAAPTVLCALALLGVLSVVSPARAERWESTPHETIDVDSIRKDGDGLVYYSKRHINIVSKQAFDCLRRVSYFVEEGRPWRSTGQAVSEGTIGAETMNFVCSHAP